MQASFFCKARELDESRKGQTGNSLLPLYESWPRVRFRSMNVLVWFKRDLRLHDHPALCHAAGLGPVLPVFLF